MKINKSNLKYTVTAILISAIVLITLIITANDYKKSNIIELPQSVADIFPEVKSITETAFNDYLLGFDNYIGLYSITQRILGCRIFDDEGYGMVVLDNDGQLHFPVNKTPERDMQKYLDSTVHFYEKVSDSGTPFLYVQLPSKKLKDYTVFPPGAYSFTNDNADTFLSGLDALEVPYYDMRNDVEQLYDSVSALYNEIDNNSKSDTQVSDRAQNDVQKKLSDLFYSTDHHWRTATAFYAFCDLIELLNKSYDFDLDNDGFMRNINNYNLTTYENCFLGSQGKRVGQTVSGLDDYTFIEPDFDTDYSVYDASVLNDEVTLYRSGNFRESIVYDGALDLSDVTINKHAAYFQFDFGDLIIKNNKVDNDLRILIIKDSFSLPLVAFLSTCVSEIHMVDLRDSGSPIPEDYIKKYDFDAVLVIYNTGVFVDPMFSFAEADD